MGHKCLHKCVESKPAQIHTVIKAENIPQTVILKFI